MTTDRKPWEPHVETTYDDWRASVNAVLTRRRGEVSDEEVDRLFRRVLTTTTDDGIVLAPLYVAQGSPGGQGLPGQGPFVRGGTASGPVPSGWDIRPHITVSDTPSQTNETALDQLANGATSLWLDFAGSSVSVERLEALLAGVYLELVPVVLSAGPAASEAAASMLDVWRHRELPPHEVRGNLGFDPIGRYARSGGVEDAEIGLAVAAEAGLAAAREFPQVAAFVADGGLYHDHGASEADELALTLATATDYLRTLVTTGADVDVAARLIEFRYAATDTQFLTIAKLRAARRLWSHVASTAGASPAAQAQRQHAVSSRAMLTRYDPWVNLLRTTVAGFAAGTGGADAVTIEPHDLLLRGDAPTGRPEAALGVRLARNVATILIEESHLARVVDPAGGSWFAESLTDELARAAWSRFQQLEAAGGMTAALAAGLPQQWIAETRESRRVRIAHRRQPITGVSEFPNLADEAPPAPTPQAGPTPFPPVVPHTYAEDFESLRDRAAAHAAATGERPAVFLATLGPLAEYTARASFVTNLFAAGGLATTTAGTVTADTVVEQFRTSGAAVACICGSNDRYATEAVTVAEALAQASPGALYLAGDPGDLREALDAAGVNEYVVAGGDAVDLLTRALTAAGVTG